MNPKSNYSYKLFENFPDISIIELITLQLLIKNSKPILRYSLFMEVNQFLKSRDQLSTSTFYNSLKKLERKGYISSKQLNSSKRCCIKATQLAESTIQLVFQSFIQNSIIKEKEFLINSSKIILEKMGRNQFKNVLSIHFHDYIDTNVMDLLAGITDDIFIVAKKKVVEYLSKIGLKNFRYSEIYNSVFREPNNVFDLSVIYSYSKNPDLYNLSRIDILKEAVRVTKENGIIVIVARSKPPKIENFYANELTEMFSMVIQDKQFTEAQLREDLESVNLSKLDIFEHNGLLVGIGWV